MGEVVRLPLAQIRAADDIQMRAQMDWVVVDDYAEAMRQGDTFPPVVVFHDGANHWLADGFHRIRAMQHISANDVLADVRQGTKRDAILHAVQANADHGLRRTNADKRRTVTTLLQDDEWRQWSDYKIAEACRVSAEMVRYTRASLPKFGSEESSANVTYITKHGTIATMDTTNIGRRNGQEGGGDMTRPYLAAANHAISDTPGYDGDEWYTPSEYIEAARELMGSIDLDPATCEAAQSVIAADHYFTKEDDGLTREWFGNVWLNPPYSQPLIDQFVDKVIREYESDRVASAVVLTNNSSDTGWFHRLLSRYPACFTRGRIRFWRPDHAAFGTRQGQTIFYLGVDVLRFESCFGEFGQVVMKL